MKIPDHPTQIQNETITLDEVTYPILDFQVVLGKFTDPYKMKFNWTFVDFTPFELLI